MGEVEKPIGGLVNRYKKSIIYEMSEKGFPPQACYDFAQQQTQMHKPKRLWSKKPIFKKELRKMRLDTHGLIVGSLDADAGDQLQRSNMYLRASHDKKYFSSMVLHLEIRHGIWRRSWRQWTDPKDLPRDQIIGLPGVLAKFGMKGLLKDLFCKHFNRKFRYQNGDIGFVEILAIYGRAFGSLYPWTKFFIYPLLLIGDFFHLVNTFNRIGLIPRWNHDKQEFTAMNKNDTGDDQNHIILLDDALYIMPTPISWLARKLYLKFRKFLTPVQALRHYHRKDSTFGHESNGNPALGELWVGRLKHW